MGKLKSIEICAGAGGQALGLELAGFDHHLLVEIDKEACNTLRLNRQYWRVIEQDVRTFNYNEDVQIDLLAGGVPCPPFSIAGNQNGKDDDRDLFPEMIRLAESIKPRAILIENVKGILSKKFDLYREHIEDQFEELGYKGKWKLLYSSHYGVSQLRPRAVFVAFVDDLIDYFDWPMNITNPLTVGQLLYGEMSSLGWKGVKEWKETANRIAPTLVGGSKKHGGPDLGPTRARNEWKKLGVNGSSLAEFPPENNFIGLPRLTNKMAALLQGFPDFWKFSGKKTNVYRQIGNAFPPPVAQAIGLKIKDAINKKRKNKWQYKRGKVLELNFENIS